MFAGLTSASLVGKASPCSGNYRREIWCSNNVKWDVEDINVDIHRLLVLALWYLLQGALAEVVASGHQLDEYTVNMYKHRWTGSYWDHKNRSVNRCESLGVQKWGAWRTCWFTLFIFPQCIDSYFLRGSPVMNAVVGVVLCTIKVYSAISCKAVMKKPLSCICNATVC